ncbi:hypothetical protein QBC47DRAFT_453543 [Echria macrotheca]|uniref:Hemerythrin-like domain-containing protein n=1 Tax=Echria macrotheca TaxID=438768 RepID=A0AAJ0BAN5_9PEZI|nr:hypothetical protein QBC47DRAFT_453543 [Echria macrotheca]
MFTLRVAQAIPRSAAVAGTHTLRFQSTIVRVSDSIKRDHRELEEYYNNMMVSKDADTAKRWQNQFVWELARHSIAEEIVVYPAMEKYIANGLAMAEKDRSEHQTVKNKLYDFQSMDPQSSEFRPALQSLWADLSEHIKEEERDDLPALEKAIDQAESERLGDSFSRTKHFVPTRSHPSAPNKPPYETVAGMLATPLDKLRDMFAKFPKEDTPKSGKSAEMIG